MAKFEQMILQDEYDACIKGCQTASCRNKDYFHFVGRNVKEVGRNVRAESRQTGDPLYSETYLGALVQAGVPSEIYVCAGNLSVGDGAMPMARTARPDGKERQLIFNEAQFKE